MDNNTKKQSTLKIIILTLLVTFILVLIIHFTRNAIIINNLQNTIKQFSNSTNYYEKSLTYNGLSLSTIEYYTKNNSSLYTTSLAIENEKTTFSTYNKNNETQNTYVEKNNQKIAYPNSENITRILPISNYLETKTFGEFISKAFTAQISSAYCNGKECYKISNIKFTETSFSDDNNSTVYIEKSTGLPIRFISGREISNNEEVNSITDYYYDFNNVTDEDLKEPDINEYTIYSQNSEQ